jgi:hypothetical protein
MDKRAHTILGLHIPTPVTLSSSASNYLQVPCTCFALCAASHFASRVNVAEVRVIDACCNIFKLSHEHRTMMMYWFSSGVRAPRWVPVLGSLIPAGRRKIMYEAKEHPPPPPNLFPFV